MTPEQSGTATTGETAADLRAALEALLTDFASATAQVQSPDLYLQAAGSDGSDGSADGIQLRWDLLRGLGKTHLPKGDLAAGPGARYPAAYGFNRADDYVTVLRVPYAQTYPCVVNFANDRPASVVESGPQRLWKFDTTVASATPGAHREVVIRFDDIARYDATRAALDPRTSPARFLSSYGGVVEAEVTGHLCFALTLTAVLTGERKEAPLRVEAVSVSENLPDAELFISCRKRFLVTRPAPPQVGQPQLGQPQVGQPQAGEPQAGEPQASEPQASGPRGGIFGALLRLLLRLFFNIGSAEEDRREGEVKPEVTAAPLAEHRIFAENVRYFRFDCSPSTPRELRLETYEQFIVGSLKRRDAAWWAVGTRFALTDRDALAFKRLEDPALLNVNGKWPRYYGADPASGLFTTSVPNYRAKWDPTLPPTNEPTDDNGLRKGVVSYLTLSMNPANATADAALPADSPTDGGAFDISYLQMLKLVALADYHVARMLGLGCIDARVPAGLTARYVYLAVYRTAAALEPGTTASPRTHLYMTLPTSRRDYRLPPAPVQEEPTFGITFDNGTGTPTQLTDADGYTPFDDSRMINLHLRPYDTLQEFGPFFVPPTEFCSSEVTRPVVYGFKYKLVSEASHRVPEPSNDAEFRDPSGVEEVVPLLPQHPSAPGAPTPPIYTHEEKEEGKHRYEFYGVNWFSLPSPLGNPQEVETLFPQRNTLLPPANLAVHLVQPEDPLMLTTPREQQMLATLPAADSTLVRCTFDWNQNHYVPQKFSAANAYADKVQLYFRQEPPRAVQGKIKSVTSVSNNLAEVRTESYTLNSVSPPQTVTPAVLPADEPRFVGSAFAAAQVLYLVDGVSQSAVPGEGPVFRVRKQLQTTVSDLDNNNQYTAATQVTVPPAGARFLVVENMNEPANWGASQPLTKEVALVNFLDGGQLHTETVSYPDGSQSTFNIGGIVQTADIVQLEDIDSDSPVAPPRGDPIPGSKTGIYEITFNSYQLAAHPDADVEWYKGTVRVREAAGSNLKVLDVWKIGVSGPTLKLTVFDPTFKVDGSYAPLPGYNPIQTGAGVLVNFHPGYRVYLRAQAGVLDLTTTLPGPADEAKQTFLAARALNTTLTNESNLTPPVVIQARKIVAPVPPEEPAGPLYATRPNFFGKATWTMDVKVAADATREPYALLFYRANERAVLDTLYDAATVEAVEAALKALPDADAAFSANRWRDLVNVQNLHSDKGFNEYTPGGYRFPIPDNADYVIPGTATAASAGIKPFAGGHAPGDAGVTFTVEGQALTFTDVVRNAVEAAFLPLTQSPLVYRFIKTGTQTSSRQPVMRDSNGDLLPLNSAAFDPAPMAVRYVDAGGNTVVRFTDYTLDGASKNIYFYFAAEMNDQMRLSQRSPIAGPVRLVNAYPSEAPVIRQITSVIKDSVLNIPTGVRLYVNAYLAVEGITRFNLYRATDAGDAAATRTMKLVRAYAAAAGTETEIFDDFADLDFPPFGEPIFYRVVALREIVNERDETEYIPSRPSELALASVIDVENPAPPPLVFSSDPPTMSQPVQLHNAVLSWSKVTHNATYYLYKQDASGNWTQIYREKMNDDTVVVPLTSTALGSGMLPKQDAGGSPVYHRFKVDVENASGMFNLNDEVLSIPATCKEGYSFVGVAVSYADDFQSAAPLSDRLCDPAVTTFPGSMTFQDIIQTFPTAHVFDRIEITVNDGLGHSARQTISAAGGAVTFHHGDGTGVVLDGSVTNVRYSVRVRVITDSCQDGMSFTYKLHFGPEIALMAITGLLSYTDSMTTTSPLESFSASGLQFPSTMSFTDIAVLPVGHTFVSIEIQLEDDQGGSFSKSISTAHGSVTFNHGDGGLSLDASAPRRTYLVSARLFTDMSLDGILFQYSISYG